MTRLQKIQIAQSECREAINVLINTDDRTDAQNGELRTLTATMAGHEVEYRAALSVEGDSEREAREAAQAAGVDSETRERLELRSRSTLGAFVAAALSGRLPGGAEAEYAAAHHAPAGSIPLDLWETDRPRETRAVTPAPATGTGVTVAPVQPFVFAPSIAPRLGIDMPSVGSGGYSEMTITTAPPASAKAKSADADDTAGALTAVTANPRRLSARMSVSLEDVASVGHGGERRPGDHVRGLRGRGVRRLLGKQEIPRHGLDHRARHRLSDGSHGHPHGGASDLEFGRD